MRTFEEPIYNSDSDEWQSNIVETPDRDDDEYELEHNRVKTNKKRLKSILKETVVQDDRLPNWILYAIYTALYSGPNMVMHINRVRGMIHRWMEVTTYQDLVDAEIIDTDLIIHNYYN